MTTPRKMTAVLLFAACTVLVVLLSASPGSAEGVVGWSAKIRGKETLRVKGAGSKKLRAGLRLEFSDGKFYGRDSLGNELWGHWEAANKTGGLLRLRLGESSLRALLDNVETAGTDLLSDDVRDYVADYSRGVEEAEASIAEAERARMRAVISLTAGGSDPETTEDELDRLQDESRAAANARHAAYNDLVNALSTLAKVRDEVRPHLEVTDYLLTARVKGNKIRVSGRFNLVVSSEEWNGVTREGALTLQGRGSLIEPKRVFLLGDTDAEDQVTEALEAAGHEVTFAGHYAEWDGMNPSPEGHDVILFLEGRSYGQPLLPAASGAILDYVRRGGGLIRTEWGAWSAPYKEEPEPVDDLLPVAALPGGDYDYASRWKAEKSRHPLTFGLPETGWTDGAGYTYLEPRRGAKVVLMGNEVVPMLTWDREWRGRVVHLNHDMTYWTDEVSRQALDLLLNAVEFAGR
jgi:hypothetical protein